MKLLRITFTELHEVEGAFGNKWISPGGGGFPKHLIHSYDLKKGTVVFPNEWEILITGGTNDDNWKHTGLEFVFSSSCSTILLRECVTKIDYVEVNYDPNDFEPNRKLVIVTVQIQRRNKVRMDGLIVEYRRIKWIVAERSRESTKITNLASRKKRTVQKYLYEFVMQKSKWKGFARQLYEHNLVPRTERFAILAGGPVFPRQLANFT